MHTTNIFDNHLDMTSNSLIHNHLPKGNGALTPRPNAKSTFYRPRIASGESFCTPGRSDPFEISSRNNTSITDRDVDRDNIRNHVSFE